MKTSWIHAGWAALTILLAGNVMCSSETAGKEITFSAAVAGATSTSATPSSTFVTHAGWSVTLSRALVMAGPAYFYEGAPQASWFERLSPIRVAHACPTHAQYNKGAILGEVLVQAPVDLLGKATEFRTLSGIQGTVRTVELHLHPPGQVETGTSGTAASELRGQTVLLEGVAEKAQSKIPFVASMSIPDEGLLRIVEGIAADVPVEDEGKRPGLVVVEVLLDGWLSGVEFDSLTEKQDDKFVFTDGTQAWTALIRGLRARQSYRIAWRAE